MKITIVNTTDIRGGAAIAAFRLFKLIRGKFPETKMLVREKLTTTEGVIGLNRSFFQRALIQFRFYLEVFTFIIRSKSRDLWFAFSLANTGQDISNLKEIRDADIIHLHWINGGFLSPGDIQKLIKTGKPIVWTLHDMWAFTGGCHYSGSCSNYKQNCGNCFFLKFPGNKDISYRAFSKKQRMYSSGKITFVAVSNWMADIARKSELIGRSRIEVIPNPIDIEIFKSEDKLLIRDLLGLPRDKFLILSGAANLRDKRKGFIFLLKALRLLSESRPELAEEFGLITFGKSKEVIDCPVPVYPQAYLKDDYSIARLYQSADVYVLPTLEDNLPSTIMESLSCGTPVVAYNTGGIPDMVDHKVTGYLAKLKSIDDLINGINWVKDHPDTFLLRQKCRKKVVENFSSEVIKTKYSNFYRNLLIPPVE